MYGGWSQGSSESHLHILFTSDWTLVAEEELPFVSKLLLHPSFLIEVTFPSLPSGLDQQQLASDPLYTSLPLFTSFLKSYGRVYLGPPSVISDPSQDPIPGEAPSAVEEELVPVEMQKRLRVLFDAYYEGLGKVVTRGRVVSGLALC